MLLQSREKDGTVSVIVGGYVTKDPYIPESGKVVLFSVCHGKDKYKDCKVWADKKAGKLAACLEKHDEVVVYGVIEPYTGKDGKERFQIAVDHIAVQQEPMEPQAAPRAETGGGPLPEGFTEQDGEDDGELPF